MKIQRVIFTGLFNWVATFSIFITLMFLPFTKDSLMLQNLFFVIAIAIFAYVTAALYYKNGHTGNGLAVGLAHLVIPLLMDSIITIPFILIPYGSSYQEFFTNPILLPITAEVLVITYAYWRLKAKASFSN
ncbi:hypothetical protein BKI52_13175 [marine bacterium AO1-C]|nr:hypothetical protein BKI52_13175 [marine bacterium AO1-C]